MQFEPFYSYRHGVTRAKAAGLLARRAPALRPPRRRGHGGVPLAWWTFPAGRCARTWRRSRCAPCAPTATCRRGCRSATKRAISNWKAPLPVKRIVALLKPTDTLRPPVGKDSLWRLISQLSLNYLSLVEEGREALQEILRLYNFTGSTYSEKQIAGLVGLASRRHFARVVSEDGVSFARGTQVEMEFDEEQFVGSGVYLFAAVLESFPGAVRLHEQLQPAPRANAPEKGGSASSGRRGPDRRFLL